MRCSARVHSPRSRALNAFKDALWRVSSPLIGLLAPFALQQAESGTQVAEVCRKMGIAEATFYRWKQLYGGLMPSEVKKLRQLEEENTRLRGWSPI
jgi:putative transposase